MVLVVVVWAACAAAADAVAGPVGVVAAGDVEAALLGEARRAAMERLRASGREAAVLELDGRAIAGLRRCVREGGGEPCRAVVTVRTDLSNWLFLDATREASSDGAAHDVVTGWWLDGGGQVLAGDRRYCAGCTRPQIAASVRELVGTLLEPRAGGLRTALVIRSRPAGAVVAVDGRTVGVTAMEYAVPPGTHRLRLERAGYRAEERQVSVAAGATTSVEVAMSPEEAAAAPSSGSGRRVAGWSLIGGGAAMIASGVVLFSIDRPEIEDDGRQAEHRDSAAWGLGVGAAGVVAAGVGAWLLVTGGEESPGRLVVAPTAQGGLWVQAGMRF